MWLTVSPGDEFITLDPSFVLSMCAGADGLVKQDDFSTHCGGVKVAYVLQYQLGEPNGMDIQKGGLVLLHHLGTQRHWANLFALAGVMQKKMANLSTKVPCMQARSFHTTGPMAPSALP